MKDMVKLKREDLEQVLRDALRFGVQGHGVKHKRLVQRLMEEVEGKAASESVMKLPIGVRIRPTSELDIISDRSGEMVSVHLELDTIDGNFRHPTHRKKFVDEVYDSMDPSKLDMMRERGDEFEEVRYPVRGSFVPDPAALLRSRAMSYDVPDIPTDEREYRNMSAERAALIAMQSETQHMHKKP